MEKAKDSDYHIDVLEGVVDVFERSDCHVDRKLKVDGFEFLQIFEQIFPVGFRHEAPNGEMTVHDRRSPHHQTDP